MFRLFFCLVFLSLPLHESLCGYSDHFTSPMRCYHMPTISLRYPCVFCVCVCVCVLFRIWPLDVLPRARWLPGSFTISESWFLFHTHTHALSTIPHPTHSLSCVGVTSHASASPQKKPKRPQSSAPSHPQNPLTVSTDVSALDTSTVDQVLDRFQNRPPASSNVHAGKQVESSMSLLLDHRLTFFACV